MSDHLGLAGLLAAMQPREPEVAVPVDIEALRAEGFADGFAAGHGAGHGAGRGAAEAELVPLKARLVAAVAAFEAACVIDGDALRPLVAELVGGIAEAVIMADFAREPALLARLVDAALALVRPGETATLRAHPATLAALPMHGVVIVEDDGLAADEFIISGPDFVIETGLRARLEQVMEAMA